MFAPHCPRCQTRVLLGPRRIVTARATPDGGRAVVLRCWCGELVVDDLGGADPAVPSAAPKPLAPEHRAPRHQPPPAASPAPVLATG